MTKTRRADVEKEILRPLWKVHILHHADQEPIIGNWMLEELRAHGYRVSPGTLYPLLARMVRLGWLRASAAGKGKAGVVKYSLSAEGRAALAEVRVRLDELRNEVFAERSPPVG
jgi:DNA-binding PadR family transcriptional regulator